MQLVPGDVGRRTGNCRQLSLMNALATWAVQHA